MHINKTATELLSEYRTISEDRFQKIYGIILNADGSVFDKSSKRCYSCLKTWAENKTIPEIFYD